MSLYSVPLTATLVSTAARAGPQLPSPRGRPVAVSRRSVATSPADRRSTRDRPDRPATGPPASAARMTPTAPRSSQNCRPSSPNGERVIKVGVKDWCLAKFGCFNGTFLVIFFCARLFRSLTFLLHGVQCACFKYYFGRFRMLATCCARVWQSLLSASAA